MLELTIAWRNLWRHQGKSLVIGAILFLGASLLTKLRREPSALEGAMRLTELQLAAPVR